MSEYECLIVDDEEALSQSTCEYFNMFGVNTYWVADEKACFDFLSQNKTDLILLDINLGQSTGFAICKRLRLTSNTPILFISAMTMYCLHSMLEEMTTSQSRIHSVFYLQKLKQC